MQCPHCNSENADGARFCANCGKDMTQTAALNSNPVPPSAPVNPPPPSATYTPPAYPAPAPQYTYPPGYARPAKDKQLAFILELLPGLFGFVGIGWIYLGNNLGFAWLAGVLLWDCMAIAIDVLTGGFACFCTIPANIGIIALSLILLNDYAKKHPELFA